MYPWRSVAKRQESEAACSQPTRIGYIEFQLGWIAGAAVVGDGYQIGTRIQTTTKSILYADSSILCLRLSTIHAKKHHPEKDGGLQSIEEKEIYILSHPFLDAIVTTTLRKSICRFLQEMSIQYAGGY